MINISVIYLGYLFTSLYILFYFLELRNIKKRIKHVWKGHGADSEIGNMSAI